MALDQVDKVSMTFAEPDKIMDEKQESPSKIHVIEIVNHHEEDQKFKAGEGMVETERRSSSKSMPI